MKDQLDRILEVRRKIRIFLISAVEKGVLQESFQLAMAISKMVASGGADPASIVTALKMLEEIDADLDTAVKAAQPST